MNAQQQVPLRVPFDYVIDSVVPLNGTTTVPRQFDEDADFEWVMTVATRTDPRMTVQLTDSATGRVLTSNPVNIDNFAGTAALPFPLVEPYVIARSSSMRFVFAETSGAQNTVQIVLRGYKLYPSNAPAQGASGLVQS
jgi:hypothetical protein